ncbi:MAG TPA: PP0621 family protein [Burkholderiaceae bacterium]|nr:PP0621 family protein [Burkholderiaceae bacterium]
MLLRVLLVVLLVGVVLWWLSARPRSARDSRTLRQPQAFARCAHCGVHLPLSDAVIERDIAYCSEAHRLAGPRDGSAT